MSKILILFAQTGEARATLDRFNAEAASAETANVWAEGHVPCHYRFEHGSIVICGVGLHWAQMSVAKHAHAYDEVWNFGLAGHLKGHLPIGELEQIETVGKYVPYSDALDDRSRECVAHILPPCHLAEGKGKLISSDFPIHDLAHQQRLAREWDLVDMEGYGIAFACGLLGKKCRMWKIISDFASPGGRELIRKHKAALSEKIADKISEILDEKQHESSPHP